MLFVCFVSCTEPQLPQQTQNQEVVVKEDVTLEDLNEQKTKRYIRYYMNQVAKNDVDSVLKVRLFSRQLLPLMYKSSGFKPMWLDEKNIGDAMEAIKWSSMDGLLPEDYHWSEISALFDELITQDTIRYEDLAKLDIMLSDGIIFYAFHLLKGKVNPESLDVNWNFEAKAIPKDALKLFLNAIKKKSVKEELYKFRPYSEHYVAMLEEQKRLIKLDTSKIVIGKLRKGLQIDDEHDAISAIRKKLIALGDLQDYETEEINVYDVTLEEGVRTFQMRHGLYPDGLIGKETIEMMNISRDERRKKIAVNMERLRWIQGENFEDAICVNIATFSLTLFRNAQPVHTSNVMTGEPYHKTPIFKAKLEYIEFNPTWTVPYSISTKEILPKLKKDKKYLERNEMELFSRDGQKVDPARVDFTAYSRSNFPFAIRQMAGKNNALGEVKFIFPNKYSVYLHDTQSKALFQRTSRAFSHGCIRVEHPLKLAEVILSDSINWNKEKINAVVATRKTTRVNLSYDLAVLLQYYTAGLHRTGKIFYFPDVYDRDEELYQALIAPYNPATALHQKLIDNVQFESDSTTFVDDENAL